IADDKWEAVAVEANGSVWAGSRTRPIELPNGGARFLRRDSDLPPVSSLGTILAGGDGQLWVPTIRGLARRTAAGWDIIGQSRGLPVSTVQCALEDREGSIWMSLDG